MAQPLVYTLSATPSEVVAKTIRDTLIYVKPETAVETLPHILGDVEE